MTQFGRCTFFAKMAAAIPHTPLQYDFAALHQEMEYIPSSLESRLAL